jgi:hypothetical protein
MFLILTLSGISAALIGDPFADVFEKKPCRFCWLFENVEQMKPEPKPQPVKDTRPIVRLYSTDPCTYCELAKTAFAQQKRLPFRVRVIDTTGGEVPTWVEAYPTFHWQGADGWRQSVGWPGVDAFLAMWKRTQGGT